jgi:hypothetical protein
MNMKKAHTKIGRSSLAIVRKHFPQVEIVIDGTRPVTIKVNGRDTTSKAIKNPLICAFALSCQRAFRADGVIIGLTSSYIIKGRHALRYKNPESVSREIVSFDRNAGFEEGVYQLSTVEPSRRFGVAVHRGGNLTGKMGKRFRHVTKNVRVVGELPFER